MDLELDGPQLRALVDAALARLQPFVDSLPDQPAFCDVPDVEGSAPRDLPRRAAPIDEVLDELFDRVLVTGYNTTSPGFLSYLGGGGLPHAAVADLIAGITNRFVGRWAAAPAAARLENEMLHWFAQQLSLPSSSGGMFTSGGSSANLTAIFVARQQHLPIDALAHGRIYVSEEVHFSMHKAALVCGLPPACMVTIPTDTHGRLDADALRQCVTRDRRQGLRPFLIIASAGTFRSGSVDPLDDLAALAHDENLWLHVDAAYGAFFMLTDRGRHTLHGVSEADSVSLDPHKSLFMPYGTGALLVRDKRQLYEAHRIEIDRYGPTQTDLDRMDACSLGMEQTRPFRGLRVWLSLQLIGVDAFARGLDEKLDLARHAATALRRLPNLDVLEPDLTVVLFRVNSTGDAKATHLELLDRVHADRKVLLMEVHFRGASWIRLCVLSFRTHREIVDTALHAIERGLADMGERATSQPHC